MLHTQAFHPSLPLCVGLFRLAHPTASSCSIKLLYDCHFISFHFISFRCSWCSAAPRVAFWIPNCVFWQHSQFANGPVLCHGVSSPTICKWWVTIYEHNPKIPATRPELRWQHNLLFQTIHAQNLICKTYLWQSRTHNKSKVTSKLTTHLCC